MIEMKNPAGSSILDPVLEEWMVRKHCIHWVKVQVWRIKPCCYPGINPSEVRAAVLPQLHQPTNRQTCILDFSSLPFQLIVTGECDRRCQLGQVACCGLGMGAGRATRCWGRQWGGGLQRGGCGGSISYPAAI